MTEVMFYRGRVAMSALLQGLGTRPGAQVAIQAYTCVAVVDAVLAAGARPLYVDVSPDSVTMDPDALERALHDADGEVGAVVVQHTFGIPAAMDELMDVARRFGVPVVEDCCHTYASYFGGRRIGSFGAGAFSSYEWGKPLVAGVGGSAQANDPGLAGRLTALADSCRRPGPRRVLMIELELAAFRVLYGPRTFWLVREAFRLLSRSALVVGSYGPGGQSGAWTPEPEYSLRASSVVERRVRRLRKRRGRVANRSLKLAADYEAAIAGRAGLRRLHLPAAARPVYARFPVAVDDKDGLLRLARRRHLEVADWYTTPVHPLQGEGAERYGYTSGQCPHAEARTREVVSLPIGPRVRRSYLRRVTELLREAAPVRSDGVATDPSAPEIVIERLGTAPTRADLTAVADLHRTVIRDGFLASLDVEVLESVYAAMAKSDHAFIHVARRADGTIIGYICGSLDSRRVTRDLVLGDPLRMLALGMRVSLRAEVARKVLETMRYPGRRIKLELPAAEILNFCVAPEAQGTGVGRQLFDALVSHFRSVGVPEFAIVTGETQRDAQRFYARAGSVRVGEIEVHRGSGSIVYVHRSDAAHVGS